LEAEISINKYYITSVEESSGICVYSRNFYDLILRDFGFKLLDTKYFNHKNTPEIRKQDIVHFEIGLNRKVEIEWLLKLLKAGYKHIRITLHDPPRLKYPYFSFRNPILNGVSKIADLVFDNFGINQSLFRKMEGILVLNTTSLKILKKKFGLRNVCFVPHIISKQDIYSKPIIKGNHNILFFGFLGQNKGIEEALMIHKGILQSFPDSHFFIIGGYLSDKIFQFIESLKKRFLVNVHFLGFVEKEKLPEIFEKANYVLLPFKEYKYFKPTSGSVLTSLSFNKILFTHSVNTVGEIIKEGYNGFFLNGNLNEDIKKIVQIMKNEEKLEAVKENIKRDLLDHYSDEKIISILNLNGYL